MPRELTQFSNVYLKKYNVHESTNKSHLPEVLFKTNYK